MLRTQEIKYFIMMGDSLSDRGTMANRKLFGIIPMNELCGLKKSPKGRFTNGYVWTDEFGAFICEKAIIHELALKRYRSDDIADGLICNDKNIKKFINHFHLNEDNVIEFKGQPFVRSYVEGGLTAHDYFMRITYCKLKLCITEKILSTLDKKRNLLLEDDIWRGVTQKQKNETLIVEWSGANDLITVNRRPTKNAVKEAIESRINNVEKLIDHGYSHFVLLNLPDLSYTPRYRRLGGAELKNAKKMSLYFNQKLAHEVFRLRQIHPNCSLHVFDVNDMFTDAFKHPNKYGIKNTTDPYLSLNQSGTNHEEGSKGHMFWDDVHPSCEMHALLGNQFYEQYSLNYHFKTPHETPKEIFQKHYGQKLLDDKRGHFGFFKSSRLHYQTASLEEVFNHALHGNGRRTKHILTDLGWLNSAGKVTAQAPDEIKGAFPVDKRHCVLRRSNSVPLH